MEDIKIEGYKDVYFVPTVNFSVETGECEIAGESFLEETEKFYNPLIDWIQQYIEEKNKPLKFIFKLNYFNTSSSRCILDLLKALKKYQEKGGEVTINWHYDEDDIDMEEALEDYIIETGLNINLYPY